MGSQNPESTIPGTQLKQITKLKVNKMGNCITTHPGQGSDKFMRRQMDSSKDLQVSALKGITTVKANSVCDFSRNSDLCICIVTWNMNGQVSNEDLLELIGSNRKFDLLVVGLQEAPRKNIARLLDTALADTHTPSCSLFIYMYLGLRIHSCSLKVDKHSIGGFGGLTNRKKGAVAIRINCNGIRIVFISCHLSAHANNVEERNSQCRHISHGLFSKNFNPYARPAQIIVWLGDLNYRIQGIDTHPARNLIQKNLHRVRVPSWTDRILFKIEDMDKISASLHSYESIDNIYSSDHKPVKAHLCLKVDGNSLPVNT
ncbi:hypothetical protein Tsubulata_039052 [Turnera subulata]|uniref:Inositol polyphosphate-related phosphatase domain-containing protein n=1 Tax=Turnera subulata TaxID=218843 RepID=A0A9Q0J8Q5_9ROSI|nr:hypothetical protein Tsubulata_039052 [Turnera subulata]